MESRKTIEVVVVGIFFVFSVWLMDKSFGYDAQAGEFRIARHEVGDFGLHISLIRSFSWGNNFSFDLAQHKPPESPFFPGEPLPYHYGVDLFVGLLQRAGVRIDYALNGVSAVFLTLLLYLIYRLTHTLFGSDPLRSMLSVSLFLLSSNLSFVDFLKGKTLSPQLVTQAWRLPDYLHKGPFDGSIISIFSSLNPLLNQRHLIVALALSLLVISYLVEKFVKRRVLRGGTIVILGALIGLSTRIHSLIALSTALVAILLVVVFKRVKLALPLGVSAFLSALPHLQLLVSREGRSLGEFLTPGFLAARPLTLLGWWSYWWQNTGLTVLFLPIGFFLTTSEQRKVFLSFSPLFIIANILQLSYRMEHNYAMLTLFLIAADIVVAHAVFSLWQGNVAAKIAAVLSVFLLTASGILNLMVVKNDFQYRVADAPNDTLIQWVRTATPVESVFVAPQTLYDPVTLAGRKNYFGATYYTESMGYATADRRELVARFFEASSPSTLDAMRLEGIDYMIVPNGPADNFPYSVNRSFLKSHLEAVYEDAEVTVFKV